MQTATIRKHAWQIVPEAALDMEQVRADLYIPNTAYAKKLEMGHPLTKNDYEGIELWEHDGPNVWLPRSYAPPVKPGWLPKHVDETPLFLHRNFPKFRRELRPDQIAPYQALVNTHGDKLLCLGCVAGDTELQLNRGGKGFRLDIATAYRSFHRLEKRGGKYWREDIPTFIRAKVGDHVRLQRVNNIIYSGMKVTYSLALEDGKQLRLTEDHEVLTAYEGYQPLRNLRPGDWVLVDGIREESILKEKLVYTRLSWYDHHPFARYFMSEGRRRVQIEEHRAVAEAALNNITFREYRERCRNGEVEGLLFIDPAVYHVHHIDEDIRNNTPANLQVLPISEHVAKHQPGYAAFGHGVPTPVRVRSIERFALEPVYDVSCEEPHHNFVANGIIIHNCGKGKTTLALKYAAEQAKMPTLIIVDQEHIAEQWEREIKACFWIPRDKIGRVQGPKENLGEHFTIAIMKTLSQRSYGKGFYDYFGQIIVDEGHVLGAPTFASIIPKFPGDRLVLTATPDRKDGMDPVFRYHAGGLTPVYTNVERTRSSIWVYAELPKILSDVEESQCMRPMQIRDRFGKRLMGLNRPMYDSAVSEHPRFNQILTEQIYRAVQKGRNVLALGGRVEQLSVLSDMLARLGVTDVGVVHGTIKAEERREAFQKQVILATWQLASKALDVPRLDTLFLFFPNDDEGFLRQAVGRIDREYDGKNPPMAVVFTHTPTSLRRKADSMRSAISMIDPKATVQTVKVR